MFDNTASAIGQLSRALGGADATGKSGLVVGAELRNQHMPFWFEIQDEKGNRIYRPDVADVIMLPINPETYHAEFAPRINVVQTLGGAYVDHLDAGLQHIQLAGTFGYFGTYLGNKKFKRASDDKMDGWEHYQRLEKTFLNFYTLFGTYSRYGKELAEPWDTSNPPRVCFFNATDKLYAVVNIDRFRLQRSVQRRFLYQYDIQMTVLNLLKPTNSSKTVENMFGVPVAPNAAPLGLLAKIVGIGQALMNLVNAVAVDVKALAQMVTGFVNGVNTFIKAPFALIGSITDSIQGVINAFQRLTNVPEQQVDMAVVTLRQTQREVLALSMFKDSFQPDTTTGTSGTGTNAKSTPTRINDTLQDIATRTLGDARKWTQLADLNNLEYPFVVSDIHDAFTGTISTGHLTADAAAGSVALQISNPATSTDLTGTTILIVGKNNLWFSAKIIGALPGGVSIDPPLPQAFATESESNIYTRALRVLTPGAPCKVPSTSMPTAAITAGEAGSPARLFGTDEVVTAGGDLAATGLGAPQTVTGYNNLKAALEHRLATRRGELAGLGHPEYGTGLHALIGQLQHDWQIERAILEAEITILDDPRIASVKNTKLISDGATALYIDCEVVPINAAPTRMSLLIGG